MKLNSIISKKFSIAIFSILLYSCSNSKMVDYHNSKISLDWAGVYKGTIPAASSPGIDLTIIIEDSSYIAYSSYIDRGDSIYTTNGKIEWDQNGSVITLQDNDDFYYKVKVIENQIQILDREGNAIDGALHDYYILNKVDSILFSNNLSIIRVGEIEIPNESLVKDPFIYFDIKRGMFSGTSGCNNFFGRYKTGYNGELKLDNIASTKMFCNNMHIEDSLFSSMTKIERFFANNDTLKFLGSQNKVLFEAIVNTSSSK